MDPLSQRESSDLRVMKLLSKKNILLLITIFSLFLNACGSFGGTETGNPEFSSNKDPDASDGTQNPTPVEGDAEDNSQILYFDRNSISNNQPDDGDIQDDDGTSQDFIPNTISDVYPIDEEEVCQENPNICLSGIEVSNENKFQEMASGILRNQIFEGLKIMTSQAEADELFFQIGVNNAVERIDLINSNYLIDGLTGINQVNLDLIDFEKYQLLFMSERLGENRNQIYFGGLSQVRGQTQLMLIREPLCDLETNIDHFYFDMVLISKEFQNLSLVTLDIDRNCP